MRVTGVGAGNGVSIIENASGRISAMVHLLFRVSKLSASKVAGSGNAPAGLSPVGQPWGRFRFFIGTTGREVKY